MLNISKNPEPLLEYFIHQNTNKSQHIYLSVLIFIVILLILLPFITVSISIQGNGIVRPVAEKTEVKSLTNEIVDKVFVSENQSVKKETPILQLKTSALDSRMLDLQYRKNEILNFIQDLFFLINQQHDRIKSPVYQQEFIAFSRQLEDLKDKTDKARKEFERNNKLFHNAVISEKEFDDYKFQYSIAENDYQVFLNNQINKWQAELCKNKRTLSEIETNIHQLIKEKELYTIKAPINGTIEQFSGIYVGSNISAGQSIATISPDSTLQIEIYISPKDIGYINQSKSVNFQIDAFNYNEWGMLTGTVKDISSDFLLLDNTAMFRVKCSLNSNFLTLKNGLKGQIKKGMSVRAHFLIAKKSLFQLLYQNINDWINPTQKKVESIYAIRR